MRLRFSRADVRSALRKGGVAEAHWTNEGKLVDGFYVGLYRRNRVDPIGVRFVGHFTWSSDHDRAQAILREAGFKAEAVADADWILVTREEV